MKIDLSICAHEEIPGHSGRIYRKAGASIEVRKEKA